MKNAMQIKAIITDLDRTLLQTDKTISPYTLKVFQACKEKGIEEIIFAIFKFIAF